MAQPASGRRRVLVAALAAVAVAAGCGGGEPAGRAPAATSPGADPSGATGAPAPSALDGDRWTVVLEDVPLGTSGIGVALHPTAAPIVVAADADRPVEACPADALGRPADPARSSFGRRWTSCRAISTAPTALPPTDGRTHVGITIRAAGGGRATLRRLGVRWRCADDDLRLRAGASRPAPVPRCAPGTPGEIR